MMAEIGRQDSLGWQIAKQHEIHARILRDALKPKREKRWEGLAKPDVDDADAGAAIHVHFGRHLLGITLFL